MDVMFRDISAAAFERLARRQVERAFADLPDDASELPWIGGEPFCYCERAVQKQLVTAALCAVRWFELEAPPWAQPLPLKDEDCRALFNNHWCSNRRPLLRGHYGLMLRASSWDTACVPPFEVFCAQVLTPSAEHERITSFGRLGIERRRRIRSNR